MTKLLEREEIKAPVAPPEVVEALEKRSTIELARQTLGYPYTCPVQEPENPLSKQVRLLGIKPFTKASYGEYKSRMVKENQTHPFWQSELWAIICMICLVAFIVSLFAGLVVFGSNQVDGRTKLLLGRAFVVTVVLLAIVVKLDCRKAFKAEWVLVPIHLYKLPIPEEVLRTAIEIKQRCPQAEIFVEEFRINEVPRDPFLVARLDELAYPLEVWNEPRFSGERQA